MIKSALHNLSYTENNNANATPEQVKYYHGLVVGVVSTLMSDGKTFQDAIDIVKKNMPEHYTLRFIPKDWRTCFE